LLDVTPYLAIDSIEVGTTWQPQIRHSWHPGLSNRVPECKKLKMWVKQQQFGTAGVEGVKMVTTQMLITITHQ